LSFVGGSAVNRLFNDKIKHMNISRDSIQEAIQGLPYSLNQGLVEYVQDNFNELYKNPLHGESFYSIVRTLAEEYYAEDDISLSLNSNMFMEGVLSAPR
jgi:hypothetical protein